jgi:hypothetical protein
MMAKMRARALRKTSDARRARRRAGRAAPQASPARVTVRRAATAVATCHCGAVRIQVRQLPRTVTSCNCSICRRYGALWAYYQPTSVTIEAPKGALAKYSWNRRIRDYHRCKRCGCVTHYTYRGRQRGRTLGVNVANFDPAALVGVRIRHLDGATSWKLLD